MVSAQSRASDATVFVPVVAEDISSIVAAIRASPRST
jgi:hypothetical protein